VTTTAADDDDDNDVDDGLRFAWWRRNEELDGPELSGLAVPVGGSAGMGLQVRLAVAWLGIRCATLKWFQQHALLPAVHCAGIDVPGHGFTPNSVRVGPFCSATSAIADMQAHCDHRRQCGKVWRRQERWLLHDSFTPLTTLLCALVAGQLLILLRDQQQLSGFSAGLTCWAANYTCAAARCCWGGSRPHCAACWHAWTRHNKGFD
jgi:hypothetical protein